MLLNSDNGSEKQQIHNQLICSQEWNFFFNLSIFLSIYLLIYLSSVTQPMTVSIPRSSKRFLLKGEGETKTLSKHAGGPSRISNPSTSPPDGGNRLAVVFGDLWRSMLTRWVSGSRQDFRVDVMKESAHFILYVWSFRGLCETGFLYRQTHGWSLSLWVLDDFSMTTSLKVQTSIMVHTGFSLKIITLFHGWMRIILF